MPKDRSGARRRHDAPVKPVAKRQFAMQEGSVTHVEVGEMEDVSGNDILDAIAADDDPGADLPHLKKKDKRQLKHELFLDRLEAGRAPYSKSHARRARRKERDLLASRSLGDLTAALAQVEDNAGAEPTPTFSSSAPTSGSTEAPAPASRARPKPGQIGAGKGAPPNEAKRKKSLTVEQFRLPRILANPDFAKNPFATIRTHARNTLVPHTVPIEAQVSER